MKKQRIRKNLKTQITGEKVPPFLSFLYSDKIHIQFDSQEPVSIFNKSKYFYDCFQIKTNQKATVDVLIPLIDTLYISDQHGNKWTLHLEYEKNRFFDVFKDFISYYKTLIKGVGSSFIIHIGLIGFFTATYYVSQQSEAIRNLIGLKSEGIKEIQANLEIAIAKEAIPFSGMSLKDYINTYVESRKPVDKVKAAANSIGKISDALNKNLLQGISGKITGQISGFNLPKLDTKSLIADSLKETRNKEIQGAKVPAAKIQTADMQAPAPQYDKKEMQIRSALLSLKPKFSQLFDEALRIDPNISVIIAYDAVIDSNGKLSQIQISTKGSGAALAINTLKVRVQKTFESLQFSKEYAGTPIHGEQVFIK